ncbi:MAG TPA: beta-N-acetylhexosaminidase [Candidatus Limnocylindrales bacterium]|nr:beta-N-acetylhexosaminidase [Candidatus Limnocylindrales bacterium]
MIPYPSHVSYGEGTLSLAAQAFSGPPEIAGLLAELGLPVAGDWVLENGFEEGYRLRAGDDGLEVRGGLAGLRWAVQTLRQLGDPVPFVEIRDAPRYPWRGSLLDVARWCHPIEFLHRYVDLMAMYKLNRLHLHLTDDQGWRFEVKRYPLLTEVGGHRAESMKGHYFDFDFDGVPHGGHYTQQQMRDLVAYARRRGVEIMPEIDLPGHTQAAIAAYPLLGNDPDHPIEVSTRWYLHDTVLNTRPETVEFFKHVLDEVADVFPFEYIHLGGDEVALTEWSNSPAALETVAALGLSGVDKLLGWWIRELQDHLAARGRRTAVWDELLEADPPEGLLFFGWRKEHRAPMARAAGFDAVSCPMRYTYFDWAESFRPGEPTAVNGFVPLEKVYSFEPGDVTGVQGQLWCEYLPTPALVEYRAFPRLAALAEVGWSSKRDYRQFDARLRRHLPTLDALKVNYRPLS